MSWVQRRLDVDHVTLLDVDMGAHMYFSGWDIVDIAGLVDVPMARHSDLTKPSFLNISLVNEIQSLRMFMADGPAHPKSIVRPAIRNGLSVI